MQGLAPQSATTRSAGPAWSTERSAERTIPNQAWGRILLQTALLFGLLVCGWEWQMRQLGLRAGDLGDGRDYWVDERRKIDALPADSIVLVGDSRLLFDTDLDTWQKLTGRRPIQLAMPGKTPQPFLHDLAEDPHFAGLAVVGTAEFSYFRESPASGAVLKYLHEQTPSEWFGHRVYKLLSRGLAFLDTDYTLFTLIEQVKWPEREGVEGAYTDVWKLAEFEDDRQSRLWEPLAHDPLLREHARQVWLEIYQGGQPPAEMVDRLIGQAQADVAKIRARGGEVVWVRPPSTGPLLDIEHQRFPRATHWDRILAQTGCYGFYFEDDPALRNLDIPDWSHLSRESALPFTESYVRHLLDHVAWLNAHRDPSMHVDSSGSS